MRPEELKTILDDHEQWLRGEGGRRADLSGADLGGACLRYAKLRCACLRNTDLRGSDLRGADLRGADLVGVNLQSSLLVGAVLDIAICRLDFGGWSICVYADKTSVGCELHANKQWLQWTPESEEIKKMHEDAPDWWATHGDAIKAVIKCVMAKSAAKGGES